MDSLGVFRPETRAWFEQNFAAPTPARNGVCTTTTTTAVTTTSTVTTTSFPPGSGQPVAGTKLLLKANPSKPAIKIANYCPASQSDVSVYKNLLFEFTE